MTTTTIVTAALPEVTSTSRTRAFQIAWGLAMCFYSMIRQIALQFFTLDIPGTLAYYEAKLGFKCLGTWEDPPVYAIVVRDQSAIPFRCAEPPTAQSKQVFGRTARRVRIHRRCGYKIKR